MKMVMMCKWISKAIVFPMIQMQSCKVVVCMIMQRVVCWEQSKGKSTFSDPYLFIGNLKVRIKTNQMKKKADGMTYLTSHK
jgi:hypothetical protein